jgi:AraC family transcriptional regulator
MSAGLGQQRLERVCAYIEGNLHEPLLLKDLAAAVFLSPFHFARMFKDSTGHPPHAFVRQRRIARACELLAGSQSPISEVARQTGFRTQSHFTGVFRRQVGLTPHRYRQAMQGQAASEAAAEPAVTFANDPA